MDLINFTKKFKKMYCFQNELLFKFKTQTFNGFWFGEISYSFNNVKFSMCYKSMICAFNKWL